MTSTDKLWIIQKKLNAPKNQENKFWGFKYRSCEDILTAVKPLLEETGTSLTISDDVLVYWETIIVWDIVYPQRFYVKATATLYDNTSWEVIASTSAFAREQLDKKWMDQSQITWAASSYARKYALNWLFCIDDSKDADAMSPQDVSSALDILKLISDSKTSVELSQVASVIAQHKTILSQEELDKVKAEYNAKLKQLK